MCAQINRAEEEKKDVTEWGREMLKNRNSLPGVEEVTAVMKEFSITNTNLLDVCRQENIFEIWTEEYVAGLASKLIEVAKKEKRTEKNPLIIMEAHAGDGRLSHFLRQKIERTAPGIAKVHAVDNGTWKINPTYEVERLSNRDALKRYAPDIVVSSWPIPEIDCTKEFRDAESVKQYIIIGFPEVCGDLLKTWGQAGDEIDLLQEHGFLRPEIEQFIKEDGYTIVPGAILDGFSANIPVDLKKLQRCRSDWMNGYTFMPHSSTIIFTREEIKWEPEKMKDYQEFYRLMLAAHDYNKKLKEAVDAYVKEGQRHGERFDFSRMCEFKKMWMKTRPFNPNSKE